MHRGVVVALVLSAGCRAVFGLEEPLRAIGDAGSDAAPDANELCFGTGPVVCVTALPTGPFDAAGNFDTDTNSKCVAPPQPGGPEICLLAGTTVRLGDLVIVGKRPVVFVATDEIRVMGIVDVSSNSAMSVVGSGANECTSASGTNVNNQGSGGAGGSFGSKGGNGGANGNGEPGAVAASVGPVAVLRGGCSGGTGGQGDSPGGGGSGGSSGGAVALVSRVSILIDEASAVFASGAGGGRANPLDSQNKGAGGGGGSGGMIVLEAPAIMMAGVVAANGGGGGGGGDCCSGFPGADGTTAQYTMAAPGGLNEGGTHGGVGGAGAAGTNGAANGLAPGSGGNGNGGGGGGGGGHGVAIVRGQLTGTQFSPTPIQ